MVRLRAGAAFLALALITALMVSTGRPQAVGAASRSTDPSSWRLGPNGIGLLRLGMSARKARALVPGLRVSHHKFCDTWTIPALDGVSMFSTHSRGGLSGVSISTYSDELEPGHGAGGVEIGDSVHKREFEQAGFAGEFYYTDGVELCA